MSRDDTTTGDTLTGYPRKPQILGRQRVAQSRLFQIESLDLRFSNGEERQFERLTGADRGAVMIIAMPDPDHDPRGPRPQLAQQHLHKVSPPCALTPRH